MREKTVNQNSIHGKVYKAIKPVCSTYSMYLLACSNYLFFTDVKKLNEFETKNIIEDRKGEEKNYVKGMSSDFAVSDSDDPTTKKIKKMTTE